MRTAAARRLAQTLPVPAICTRANRAEIGPLSTLRVTTWRWPASSLARLAWQALSVLLVSTHPGALVCPKESKRQL
jgi:hypothetical protein